MCLRWADQPSREVLQTVMLRCVRSRNLVNEEALTHWQLLRQKHANTLIIKMIIITSVIRIVITLIQNKNYNVKLCTCVCALSQQVAIGLVYFKAAHSFQFSINRIN